LPLPSGHQRCEAAKQAGLKEVPCYIAAMTDEEALRELLLSNAQSDLKPLEIGLHVLKVVGKGKGGRGVKGGTADYARHLGVERPTLIDWVNAAEVAKPVGNPTGLIDYISSLTILHRTPQEDWPDLVARMLKGHWKVDQTERYVEVIKSWELPDDLASIFPRPVLIARYFERQDFSQATLESNPVRGQESALSCCRCRWLSSPRFPRGSPPDQPLCAAIFGNFDNSGKLQKASANKKTATGAAGRTAGKIPRH
jgi:hypothetical protein